MSQANDVLRFLKSGHKLTALEALRRFGTFRLAARVLELRQKGHRIRSEISQFGDKRVAVYWMAR